MIDPTMNFIPTSPAEMYPDPTPRLFVCDECHLVGDHRFYYDANQKPLPVVDAIKAATETGWSWDGSHEKTAALRCPACVHKHGKVTAQ